MIVYHVEKYSSVGAYLGGLHMNRSTTNGFRSIIARWSWYISSTLFLVMPVGSGVIVVKPAVFGIVKLLQCFNRLSSNSCFRNLLPVEGLAELRLSEVEWKRGVWIAKAREKRFLFRRPPGLAAKCIIHRTRISRAFEHHPKPLHPDPIHEVQNAVKLPINFRNGSHTADRVDFHEDIFSTSDG